MGSGCDSPGWGQRSNQSLGSLLCHCNGSWNISPKRLRTPRRLSSDDELTAMRNYRWSTLKTHTQSLHTHTHTISSSTHLHMQMIDNRHQWHQLYVFFFVLSLEHPHTHTLPYVCQWLIVVSGWRWHHHCFYLFGRSQQLLASRRLISNCFLNAFWRLMWKCNQAKSLWIRIKTTIMNL